MTFVSGTRSRLYESSDGRDGRVPPPSRRVERRTAQGSRTKENPGKILTGSGIRTHEFADTLNIQAADGTNEMALSLRTSRRGIAARSHSGDYDTGLRNTTRAPFFTRYVNGFHTPTNGQRTGTKGRAGNGQGRARARAIFRVFKGAFKKNKKIFNGGQGREFWAGRAFPTGTFPGFFSNGGRERAGFPFPGGGLLGFFFLLGRAPFSFWAVFSGPPLFHCFCRAPFVAAPAFPPPAFGLFSAALRRCVRFRSAYLRKNDFARGVRRLGYEI